MNLQNTLRLCTFLLVFLSGPQVFSQYFTAEGIPCARGKNVEIDTVVYAPKASIPFDRCFYLKYTFTKPVEVKGFKIIPIDEDGKVAYRRRDKRAYLRVFYEGDRKGKKRERKRYKGNFENFSVATLHENSHSPKTKSKTVLLNIPPLDPNRLYRIELYGHDNEAYKKLVQVGTLLFSSVREDDSQKSTKALKASRAKYQDIVESVSTQPKEYLQYKRNWTNVKINHRPDFEHFTIGEYRLLLRRATNTPFQIQEAFKVPYDSHYTYSFSIPPYEKIQTIEYSLDRNIKLINGESVNFLKPGKFELYALATGFSVSTISQKMNVNEGSIKLYSNKVTFNRPEGIASGKASFKIFFAGREDWGILEPGILNEYQKSSGKFVSCESSKMSIVCDLPNYVYTLSGFPLSADSLAEALSEKNPEIKVVVTNEANGQTYISADSHKTAVDRATIKKVDTDSTISFIAPEDTAARVVGFDVYILRSPTDRETLIKKLIAGENLIKANANSNIAYSPGKELKILLKKELNYAYNGSSGVFGWGQVDEKNIVIISRLRSTASSITNTKLISLGSLEIDDKGKPELNADPTKQANSSLEVKFGLLQDDEQFHRKTEPKLPELKCKTLLQSLNKLFEQARDCNCNKGEKDLAKKDKLLDLIARIRIFNSDSITIVMKGQKSLKQPFGIVKITDYAKRANNLKESIQLLTELYEFALKVHAVQEIDESSFKCILEWIQTMQNFKESLDKKNALRAKIDKQIVVDENIRLPIKASNAIASSINFQNRAKLRLVPDFGFITIFKGDGSANRQDYVPYLGFHVNLRPIDKDVKMRFVRMKSWKYYLSFYSGLTLSSIEVEGQREDFFANKSLLAGIGIRINHSLRATVGSVIFRANSTNPLSDSKSVKMVMTAGISLDLEIQKFIGGIKSIFIK